MNHLQYPLVSNAVMRNICDVMGCLVEVHVLTLFMLYFFSNKDLPSDVPSLAPSSLPSSMPSSLPSLLSSSEPSSLPSNLLFDPPILDPCHDITCSNHGKCKGNGICQCEDTFVQIKDGKDCACPDGTFLHASTNRCYAPTSSPTSSPVSSPVTQTPTSAPVTTAPTPDSPIEDSCEDITGTFFVNDKEISCDWLSRNKKREEKRKNIYCALNKVKMACALTCDFCDCIDDASYTFQLKSGTDGVSCSWISKNKNKIDKRRARYCTDDYDGGALVNACTESCGLCAN